jgi:dienelactone hydrolase
VAGRFAGIGYSALAIDLLSAQGGTGKFADPAKATAELGKVPPDVFVANLKSGIGELQRRVPDKKIAVIGFCMGGGLTWQLLASGAPQLAAAFPFYGPVPDNPDFSGSKDVAVYLLRWTSTNGQRHRAGSPGRLERCNLQNRQNCETTTTTGAGTPAVTAWRRVQAGSSKIPGATALYAKSMFGAALREVPQLARVHDLFSYRLVSPPAHAWRF